MVNTIRLYSKCGLELATLTNKYISTMQSYERERVFVQYINNVTTGSAGIFNEVMVISVDFIDKEKMLLKLTSIFKDFNVKLFT